MPPKYLTSWSRSFRSSSRFAKVMLVSMLIYCSLIAYTVGLELSELGMLTMYIVGPVIMCSDLCLSTLARDSIRFKRHLYC